MRAVRRLVMLLGVTIFCAGGGSALLAAPALAGDVNTDTGVLEAALYNVTPYPMTLVAAQTPGTTSQNPDGGDFWNTLPAGTIPVGGSMLYRVNANQDVSPGLCIGDYLFGYDAYMTYRVDVLGGAPEYLTLAISGAKSHSPTTCFGTFPQGDHDPQFNVYITSAPPPAGYDPAVSPPPAAATANPQVTYAHNQPTLYDQSFQITGDYTVDASSNLGAPFVNVLNALCGGAANTACSFTQHGPLTWGIGDPGSPFVATNCSAAGAPTTQYTVQYTDAQSASLTVGGGVSVSAQFNLFDVVGNSVSVSVEASHQWTETTSITRSTTVDIPPNDIAFLWVTPVVGKVTGTLVVSNGSSTFTANNFSETRSGVTKDALTPAFDAITKARPMSSGERQSFCANSGAPSLIRGSDAKPPVKLVPGHGVARVRLGQTRAQVAGELGPPLGRHFLVDPCQGLGRRCYAAAGAGGRWSYRQLSVVFGPDLRVSGLIYRGARRSATGAGVGASLPVVRGAYPGASCSRHGHRMNCTLTGTDAGQTVRTVFGFRQVSGGTFKCDRVAIYVVHATSGQVSS
jgi:hypothetical protein